MCYPGLKYFLRFQLPAFVLFALLGAAATASAQSILLTAGDFAVLGGTAVTNSGATMINGNVGSNVAVSGFPPGIITVNDVPADPIVGGTTPQAELDLIKAANGLAGMPSNATESGELAGLTLLPGVYTIGTAATLDGSITLDANDQNNAFWVFQIGTTLITASGASVLLINPGTNGGSDDGIFWDAGSAITFGGGNTILGNYLAGTSISSDGGDAGNGRFLAQAGVTFATAGDINSHGGPGGSDYSGGLKYSDTGSVIPVPESAAFAWIFSLGALGLVLWKRLAKAGPSHV